MENTEQRKIVVVGVGGLGTSVVREALERGATVSVLVRDESKLRTRLDEETLARLAHISVGDATDSEVLDQAMQGMDVVVSGNGAHPLMARALAEAVSRNDVKKLIWPAGGTNLMSDDGVTPVYKELLDTWPGAADAYHAHQACIDAIRDAEIDYVIWAPGVMRAAGQRSADVASTVRVNRESGRFVSYEDAAWVILEAALTSTYDGQLVTAATAV